VFIGRRYGLYLCPQRKNAYFYTKDVMMEAIDTVPKTALDIFRILPEGTLCEVIDNVLYMSPAPKYTHQRLTGLLFRCISEFAESNNLGEAIISPFDVYLEQLLSAVQPDILYISNGNRGLLKDDGYIHGAPDLIVEVLSGDIKRDKVIKKNLYERAGVKEYFIANPRDRKIESYILKDGRYELAYKGEGVFTSALLGLTFSF
jgi:Uma2 family endonuclease